MKTLWLLGALDSKKSLTELGREMAFFPLEPCYARAIIASREHRCASDILDIISVLSASSPLFIDFIDMRDCTTDGRQTFYHPAGDHLTILNAVKSYRDISRVQVKGSRKAWCREHSLNERTLVEAARIRKQLSTICANLGIDGTLCSDEDEILLKCLGHGLIQNTAFLQPDGSYRQIMSTMVSKTLSASVLVPRLPQVVKIHPSSTLSNKKLPVIMYDELV
jgi:ATP-dependent RNA helicase DHX33